MYSFKTVDLEIHLYTSEALLNSLSLASPSPGTKAKNISEDCLFMSQAFALLSCCGTFGVGGGVQERGPYNSGGGR